MTPNGPEDVEPQAGGGSSPNHEELDPTEVLPPEAREAVFALVRQEMSVQFSGPIPPPALLKQYNEALPDGAERIVQMAEQQSAHRRAMETRGQFFGFSLALIVLVGAIVLIALDKKVEGLIALVGSVATLAGLFVYRESQERKQLPAPRELPSGEQEDQS